MTRKLLTGIALFVALIIAGSYAYQYRGTVKIETAETPEEVVTKFYAFINDRGPMSLGEAYKLLSTEFHTVSEDSFKNIVLNYPSDMKVKVSGGKVIDNRAIVPIEYETASAFGGVFTIKTEVNLNIDKKSQSWKIDFTGETYDTGRET